MDKEEIGSVGASSMASRFFENSTEEILALTGKTSHLTLQRTLAGSKMLSSDVSAGFDPMFQSVFEEKNAAYLGKGIVLNKYTGRAGKAASNDANPEFMAAVRRIFDEKNIRFQTAEIGRVDAGGSGTIIP